MFQSLLKKCVFVLCASISSTACLAMESEEEFKIHIQSSLDDKSPPDSVFNNMASYSEYFEREGKGSKFLAHSFKQRPDQIKFFEEQLEKEFIDWSYTDSAFQTQRLSRIEKLYLESLCLLPKSYINSSTQLDLNTLNHLGKRLLRIGMQVPDMEQKKRFIDQAIWYSILGAQSGDVISYTRLKEIIDADNLKSIKVMRAYYTFLINFLLQEDKPAQELFEKVALDSEGALDWVKKRIAKLTVNGKSPSHLEVLQKAMFCFIEEQIKTQHFQNLEKLKKSSLVDIMLLLEMEDYDTEAKKKLNELKKSKGYKNSTNAKQNDSGRLLKEIENSRGEFYFKKYCELFEKAKNKYNSIMSSCSNLSSILSSKGMLPINSQSIFKDVEPLFNHLTHAVSIGNPKAIFEQKRLLKKSASKTINFESQLASHYKIYLEKKKSPNAATIRLVKASTPQKSIPEENTTAASTTATIKQPEEKKEFVSSSKGTQKPNNTNSANIRNSTPLTLTNSAENVPVEIQKTQPVATLTQPLQSEKPSSLILLPQKENKKSAGVQPAHDSSLEQKTRKKREKKAEFPVSSSAISDQIPTESQEESLESLPTPHKVRKPLERTQSLVTLRSLAEKEANPAFAQPRRIIQRTLSLNSSDFAAYTAETSKKAPVDENKSSRDKEKAKKSKNPSTKLSFKTLKIKIKKEKAEKAQEKEKKSSSSTKTSSSKSISEEQLSRSQGQTSRSERQSSRSEESFSQSKEKVPFSKLIRALEKAKTQQGVKKLTEGTITSTLKQLNNITWRKNGNTISATNNNDFSIHMTLHLHDDSGTLWYKKPEIIDHFLWFVGECNPDLKEQISKVNKKS